MKTQKTHLSDSLMRPVRLSAGGRSLACVAALACLTAVPLGIWMFTLAERDSARHAAFKRESRPADAEVTDLSRSGSGDSRRYYAHYRYTAEGSAYEKKERVPHGRWNRLKKGSRLSVTYQASNPGESWIEGRRPGGMPFWLGPLIGASLLVLGGVLFAVLHRDKKLLSGGRAATARVTNTKKTEHGHQVEYAFRLLSGAPRTGKYGPVSKPPAVGTVVTIVYDPENPSRKARFPMSLVSVA